MSGTQWGCSVFTVVAQSTELLTDLPQLLSNSLVAGVSAHLLHVTAGEVVTAQGFQSLLQAAVQCGLSSSLGVQEEEAGYRLDEDFLPQADVAGKFSANDA